MTPKRPSEIYHRYTKEEVRKVLRRDGYTIVDFRNPQAGETFLSTDLVPYGPLDFPWSGYDPRLILKRK